MNSVGLHIPVLLEEVLYYLNPKPGTIYVDATIGSGGHAVEIFKRMQPDGLLIGIDLDSEQLNVAAQRLKNINDRFILIHDNYVNLDKILKSLSIEKVNGIFFDLGISTEQLSENSRGFSYKLPGPLDMRFDRLRQTITAEILINTLKEKELVSIIRNYGEEKYARRIVNAIVTYRRKKRITTTQELTELIESALEGTPYRKFSRIHPATRTYQALRIAVNSELENLEQILDKIFRLVCRGGRIGFIAYHSLEDRLIKRKFLTAFKENQIKLLTKKPVRPKRTEILKNPRSRSARLRSAEKI